METIEVVIKIPKRCKEFLDNGGKVDWLDAIPIIDAIVNGTVLPEGHDRLIDVNKLIKRLETYDDYYNKRFAKTPIKDIPMYDLGYRNRNDHIISLIENERSLTIIEADNRS